MSKAAINQGFHNSAVKEQSQRKNHYLNAHRLDQALQLGSFLHACCCISGNHPKDPWLTTAPAKAPKDTDSRVMFAHRVLIELATHMAQPDGAGYKASRGTIVDTCFPELVTLTRWTGIPRTTLIGALNNLISWGVITKTLEPSFKLSKRKTERKNDRWDHCRYAIVAEVFDTVTSSFAPDRVASSKAKKESNLTVTPLLAAPVQSAEEEAADAEFVAGIGNHSVSPLAEAPTGEDSNTECIVNLIRDIFSDHPTWQHQSADKIMRSCASEMINRAGSVDRAFEVLTRKFHGNENLYASVTSSRQLGGYLKRSFQGWLEALDEHDAAATKTRTNGQRKTKSSRYEAEDDDALKRRLSCM